MKRRSKRLSSKTGTRLSKGRHLKAIKPKHRSRSKLKRPRKSSATNTDIQGRKPSKNAVWESERRYRHLFNNMPIALWRLDTSRLAELFAELRAEGVTNLSDYIAEHPEFMRVAAEAPQIVEANEYAVQMFGTRQPQEMSQARNHYWQESPGTYRRILETRFRGEPTHTEETKIIARDGRVIDVLMTVARPALIQIPGTSIIGFIDISEQVRARELVQQVQAEFAHAARVSMLGELTASIAHEVNQPLGAIRTNAETGLRWLDRSEPNVTKARELILRVLDDARRASDIVTRIRAMAAGHSPQPALLALRDVITESIAFLRHELQSKNVAISLDLAPALPEVIGDRTQLQQVVVNLTMNAVQAMAQSDAKHRSIAIRTLLSNAETVSVIMEDSGPGIDPAHLPHLFDSFFTTKDAGMGMGLPISRSIIEGHGGNIQADNNSGLGGARFSFNLPTSGASV
jgi:PAS domain S-box-containing protein